MKNVRDIYPNEAVIDPAKDLRVKGRNYVIDMIDVALVSKLKYIEEIING